MRLVSLTSNRSTFKPIRFNRTGLTLIVGRHQNQAKTPRDLRKTYNGVGKSLALSLTSYCLGANRNPQLDKHLDGWTFHLAFEHDGKQYQASRTAGDSKVLLNGDAFSIAAYRKRLDELRVFETPMPPVPFLTFRSLLAFFLRSKGASYVRYDRPEPKWKDYQSVLCQSFFLGLDYTRAVEKYDLKTALDEKVALLDRYSKDDELRQFYLGEKNAAVELLELESEVIRLEGDLRAFKVAENYAERQEKADDIHRQLGELRNRLVVQENIMEDIALALQTSPDVAPAEITRLFEETTISLPDAVVKRLEDVHEFNRRLHENRARRLTSELNEATRLRAEILTTSEGLQQALNDELQFLNAHRALDEYAANSAYLSSIRSRRERIVDYQRLLAQYKEEAQRIRAELAQTTLTTNDYLRSVQPHLQGLMHEFREYSHALYGAVPAGLSVENNDGENQCRFNILAHIQNDAADGINQGKLFCYDLMLLALRQRHDVQFLFHDNRLFADMDMNQRYSLFKLADSICSKLGAQYIATVNQDVLDSVRAVAGEDYERLFVDPVVLELTDTPDGSGKLLGIQVDMDYDA